MPAAARGRSAHAAEAFARYYVDLINYAARTGRTRQLGAASAQQCRTCSTIGRNIRRVYSTGGRIQSHGWHLTEVTVTSQHDDADRVLRLRIHEAPERVLSDSGRRVRSFEGGMQSMTMYLRRKPDWSVTRLDLVR
jgi:hypothetical protein